MGGGPALVDAGTRELDHRDFVRIVPERQQPELPLVVYLGDSTFLPGYAYPRLLANRLSGRAETLLYWWEGFEPFHHYLLVGQAMAQEPAVVVIVAQPRVFWRHEPLWYEDLLTLVPPSELPRAALLPFHERSVSVPRLVLASLWGSLPEGGETLLRAFVGARKLAVDVPGLRWLVPQRAEQQDASRLGELRLERFESYDVPIYPSHPAVRALAATVEQAERRGARTLVLLSPIPVEKLRAAGLYDDATFARRIGVIERAVEGEGGELLDFHAVFEPDEFSDDYGHMARGGARKIARLLEPWLRQALE